MKSERFQRRANKIIKRRGGVWHYFVFQYDGFANVAVRLIFPSPFEGDLDRITTIECTFPVYDESPRDEYEVSEEEARRRAGDHIDHLRLLIMETLIKYEKKAVGFSKRTIS